MFRKRGGKLGKLAHNSGSSESQTNSPLALKKKIHSELVNEEPSQPRSSLPFRKSSLSSNDEPKSTLFKKKKFSLSGDGSDDSFFEQKEKA
jgi:hypothetical protein